MRVDVVLNFFESPAIIQQTQHITMTQSASAFLCIALLALPAAAQQLTFDQNVRPFLKQHCIRCHDGSDEAESELRLDEIDHQLALGKSAKIWQQVLDQLSAGEMPPRDEPRPETEEVKRVTTWISRNLDRAASVLAQDRGRALLRRLNRTEYSNTIRDLLGIEFEAGRGLPMDDSAHGFDNVGTALTLSPLLLEKYLREAERITERVILSERSETDSNRWVGNELVYHKSPRLRDGDKVKFFIVGRSNGGGAFFPLPIPFKNHGYVTTAPGVYRIRIKAHPQGPKVHASSRWRIVYKPEDFETNPEGCEDPRLLVVCNGELAARIHVEDREPKVYEFTTWAEAGKKFEFTFENGVGGIKRGWYPKYTGPGIVVHWMEIEGPIYDSWPTKAYQSIFFKSPQAEPTRDYAREILARFAQKAYRRPITSNEIDELLQIFDQEQKAKTSFNASIAVSIQRALCSPHFLYLTEPSEAQEPRRALDGYELASRLSYFLWSSMPDAELFQAAQDGSLLKNPEPQVRRMLKDPKAKALVKNFVGQWLRLRQVQDIAVDRMLYPDFTDYLRHLFVQETESFFQEILDHDLSILNFLDSDFAMLNDRLAFHYGIKGVIGPHFRRVKLEGETHRGGLMTHASVLTLTTCGTRTSPILRGVWVMECLLGMPVPPPPKDVPELPAAPRGRVSQRQRLEAHRSVKACARCHDRIDPLGIPLEHFDVIGRWRGDYGIRTRYGRNGGPPVDGRTTLTSGEQVEGPDELRKLLLGREDMFCHGFVEKLLTYALGRGLTLGDRPSVESLTRLLKENDYRMSDLIVGIAKSDVFKTK